MDNHVRHSDCQPYSHGYMSGNPQYITWPAMHYQPPTLHWAPLVFQNPYSYPHPMPPLCSPLPPPSSQHMPYPTSNYRTPLHTWPYRCTPQSEPLTIVDLTSSSSPSTPPSSSQNQSPETHTPMSSHPILPSNPQTGPPYQRTPPTNCQQSASASSTQPPPNLLGTAPQTAPPSRPQQTPPALLPKKPWIPQYYVTFPTPYYVTLHGGDGATMERSCPPPVRPIPIYPNRKRAMPPDLKASDDGGVALRPIRPKPNVILSDNETPKKNKLDIGEDVGEKTFASKRRIEKSQSDQLVASTNWKGVVGAVVNEGPVTMAEPTVNVNNAIPPSKATTALPSTSTDGLVKKLKNKESTHEVKSCENVNLSGLRSVNVQDGTKELRSDDGIMLGGKSLDHHHSRSPVPRLPPEMNTNYINLLHKVLKTYVPTLDQLKNLGYPLTSIEDPRLTLIYKQGVRSRNQTKLKEDKRKAFLSNEKTCTRCGEQFYVKGVTYLTTEKCQYHWGKSLIMDNYKIRRTCCYGDVESAGCTTGSLHVWSGISDGLNELKGFVKPAPGSSVDNIIALDCEMIFTKAGMELAKVVLVNIGRKVVYQTLVRPQHDVIDYNTRFSGVSLDDYKNDDPKPFHDVQRDLLKFIKTDTIVLGHSLENDLRVLKIVHTNVVDTAVLYPHQDGFPFRRSLKDLAQEVLGVSIQSEQGHDPVEDANTALQLVLHKVRSDCIPPSRHLQTQY